MQRVSLSREGVGVDGAPLFCDPRRTHSTVVIMTTTAYRVTTVSQPAGVIMPSTGSRPDLSRFNSRRWEKLSCDCFKYLTRTRAMGYLARGERGPCPPFSIARSNGVVIYDPLPASER